jgi:hypothetical protein
MEISPTHFLHSLDFTVRKKLPIYTAAFGRFRPPLEHESVEQFSASLQNTKMGVKNIILFAQP